MTSRGPAIFCLIALAALLLAALASCSQPLMDGEGTGLEPAAAAGQRAALALPSLDGIAAYRVTGSGPDGAVYGPVELPGAASQGGALVTTAEPLALGEWNFTVEALDDLGAVVSGATFAYTVDWNDERAELALALPPTGNGSLVVTAWWADGVVVGPGDGYGNRLPPGPLSVEYEIEDLDGTVTVATTVGSADGGWFEGSAHALAPGRYLVRARVLAEGFEVWGAALPALVQAGLQTTVRFSPVAAEVNSPPNVYALAAPGEYLPFSTTTLGGMDAGTTATYSNDGSAPATPYGGTAQLGPWIRIRAENAWGVQESATVDPHAYSFALHVSTTGDDVDPGSVLAPKSTPQVAVDLAASFANLFPANPITVQVRLEQGAYVDTNSLILEGDVTISGGWASGFSVRSTDPALTTITRNPPNGAPPVSAVTVPMTYAGSTSLQSLTILNTAPNVTTDTTAVYVAGSGRLTLMDCVLNPGSGDLSSIGLLSVGGADLVLLRNRIWGGEGTSDVLGEKVRGILVDGGSPSVYLASNAIMARKPDGAPASADAVGVEIVAEAGETVVLRMYGNTIVADGDASLGLELDMAGGGTIDTEIVNTILAAPGGASVPAVIATNNRLSTDLAALDSALAGALVDIDDYASFRAMDWTPSTTPEGDALATGGFENPDPASTDEDTDLAGTPRGASWAIGAMERE